MVLIFNFWSYVGREKKCIGMYFWNSRLLFSIYLFILIYSYMSLMSSGLLRYWFIYRSLQVVLCAWSLLRDMLWSRGICHWRFCMELCIAENSGDLTTDFKKITCSPLVFPGCSCIVSTSTYVCSQTTSPSAHLCFSLVKCSAAEGWGHGKCWVLQVAHFVVLWAAQHE